MDKERMNQLAKLAVLDALKIAEKEEDYELCQIFYNALLNAELEEINLNVKLDYSIKGNESQKRYRRIG